MGGELQLCKLTQTVDPADVRLGQRGNHDIENTSSVVFPAAYKIKDVFKVPMDHGSCSQPGFSVHGISQATVLE